VWTPEGTRFATKKEEGTRFRKKAKPTQKYIYYSYVITLEMRQPFYNFKPLKAANYTQKPTCLALL
jgi:hypothetical protein